MLFKYKIIHNILINFGTFLKKEYRALVILQNVNGIIKTVEELFQIKNISQLNAISWHGRYKVEGSAIKGIPGIWTLD